MWNGLVEGTLYIGGRILHLLIAARTPTMVSEYIASGRLVAKLLGWACRFRAGPRNYYHELRDARRRQAFGRQLTGCRARIFKSPHLELVRMPNLRTLVSIGTQAHVEIPSQKLPNLGQPGGCLAAAQMSRSPFPLQASELQGPVDLQG